jgi:hypothetical protein
MAAKGSLVRGKEALRPPGEADAMVLDAAFPADPFAP